jgi:HTH-type transcriptional regulator / antitoxin HigA
VRKVAKVIKNMAEHDEALAKIDTLLELDPAPGTEEADRLELLAFLVEDYESRHFPIEAPDPVEAIRFRMEQQGLTQRDLVPYIGSKSKTSEVLSGKRPLSLPMIRALHSGLGIPAPVLLRENSPAPEPSEDDIDWERFPLREMVKRGWVETDLPSVRTGTEDLLRAFFAPVGGPSALVALYRKTDHTRFARSVDEYALAAWTVRVVTRAQEDPPPAEYRPGTVTAEFMREVARLSPSEDGPLLAREMLREHGIPLVVEPHLPRTRLDGAAILAWTDRPVIGLSLRHDRLDNFWFCLMHELAHLALHLDAPEEDQPLRFYDDLDADDQGDPREEEADRLAGEALIPDEEWKKSPASKLRSPQAAQHLARKLGIHPAIVAGRIRRVYNSYKILTNMVGSGQVRRLFPEVNWA